jgi:hypothetical protein
VASISLRFQTFSALHGCATKPTFPSSSFSPPPLVGPNELAVSTMESETNRPASQVALRNEAAFR